MKKIILFYGFLLPLLCGLLGCEDLLSELPDNRAVIDDKEKN